VVGMPFKDQATSDTLLLPALPPSSDTSKRRALARLQARFAAEARACYAGSPCHSASLCGTAQSAQY
jgi:hypothetical protein